MLSVCLNNPANTPLPPASFNSADVDGDGHVNGDDADADGDGLRDGFSSEGGANINANADGDCFFSYLDVDDNDPCVPVHQDRFGCIAADADRDGILDIEEDARSSHKDDPDTDDDGIWDTWEFRDADALADFGMSGSADVDCDLHFNWEDSDADGDGAEDGVEGRLNASGSDGPLRLYLDRLGCSVIINPGDSQPPAP